MGVSALLRSTVLNPTLLADAAILVKRGVIAPGMPHRGIGQLASIMVYGMGLFGELRQAAKRSPGQVAVIEDDPVDGRRELTYDELLALTETMSEVLRDLGITPQARVGVLVRNHAAAIAAMAAVDALGADQILLNTGLTTSQLAQVAAEQRLTSVIADDEFVALVEDVADLTVITESDLDEGVAHTSRPRLVRPERGGRTVVLTSGTTGTPKGATRKVPPSIGPLATILDRIPFNAGERVLISAPIFHTWGHAALQLSLALRATMVLHRRFDAAAARDALQTHRIHAHVAVPVMIQRMLDLPPDPGLRDRLALRVTALSGSALPGGMPSAYMDQYGDVLYNLYGSTEASWVSIATPEDLRWDPRTSGRPPRGTAVRIVDAEGQEVEPGTVGRIFVGNDLVFDGYTSGQTKEFLDGLISTGDMGYLREGRLFVEGREDDMIVSGGENVYPDEVAVALDRLDEVRECAVIGVADERFGQRLAAFVVLHDGAELTQEEALAHCKALVSRHAVPREVHVIDELPRNATGKVVSRVLRDLVER